MDVLQRPAPIDGWTGHTGSKNCVCKPVVTTVTKAASRGRRGRHQGYTYSQVVQHQTLTQLTDAAGAVVEVVLPVVFETGSRIGSWTDRDGSRRRTEFSRESREILKPSKTSAAQFLHVMVR